MQSSFSSQMKMKIVQLPQNHLYWMKASRNKLWTFGPFAGIGQGLL